MLKQRRYIIIRKLHYIHNEMALNLILRKMSRPKSVYSLSLRCWWGKMANGKWRLAVGGWRRKSSNITEHRILNTLSIAKLTQMKNVSSVLLIQPLPLRCSLSCILLSVGAYCLHTIIFNRIRFEFRIILPPLNRC